MLLLMRVWYRWKARYLAVLTPEFRIHGMQTGRAIRIPRQGVELYRGPFGADLGAI